MNLGWLTDPVLLLVNILAGYRVLRLAQRDTLPPLPRIRQNLLHKLEGSAVADLIDCPWCLGWWISLGVTLAASTGDWWWWLAAPLAISAALGFLAARDDD